MTPTEIKIGAFNGALKIIALNGKSITAKCSCGEVKTYYKSDFARRKSCGREECKARHYFNRKVIHREEAEKREEVDPRWWELALYTKWGGTAGAA